MFRKKNSFQVSQHILHLFNFNFISRCKARETKVLGLFLFNLKTKKMAKKKDSFTVEQVLSPVEHSGKDVNASPIWKNAWHPEEVTEEIKRKFKRWFEYTIKFDGLKAIQITKTREV
jgi:hypothetical protein